jgi:hypothetical protein
MNGRINYQVMPENAGGVYLPDYDRLIKDSTCRAEADEWRELKARNCTFAWNMVYCTRMRCGHFEVFQSPQNEHYPLDEVLRQAREHAARSKCTACIINLRQWTNGPKGRTDRESR